MPKKDAGCVEPSRGPIAANDPTPSRDAPPAEQKETPIMQARVGALAPDFEAAAFVDGGFQNIKLSDYRGRWVALCFYPGDFTFV